MKELLELLESKQQEINEGTYRAIRDKILDEMQTLKIEDMFGIKIPQGERYRKTYYRIDEYAHICLFGENHRRTISWSDDGRQPEEEWLYSFGFSTGAYIFHSDYPSKTFNNFFVELKSFNPKYADTVNHNLYFTAENAKGVHDAFPAIFNAHRDRCLDEIKQNKIDKLQKELEALNKR